MIDNTAIASRDEERRKRRLAYGRQATMLAGKSEGSGAPPTMPVKTLLGA